MKIRNSSGEIFAYPPTMESHWSFQQNANANIGSSQLPPPSSAVLNTGFGGRRHGFNMGHTTQATPQQLTNLSTLPAETANLERRYTLYPAQQLSAGDYRQSSTRNTQHRLDSHGSVSMQIDSGSRSQTPTAMTPRALSNLPMINDEASTLLTPAASQDRLCQCGRGLGQRLVQSPNVSNAVLSYQGIPISALINSPPPVGLPSTFHHSSLNPNLPAPTSSDQPSQQFDPFAAASYQNNQPPPSRFQPGRSNAPSVSSNSVTMTLVSEENDGDIASKRSELLNKLYEVCFKATTKYIRSLPPLRTSHHCSRVHPYLRTNRDGSAQASNPQSIRTRHQEDLSQPRPTRSLMNNISNLSTYLWRSAVRAPLTPHKAEASAASNMNDLYAWSEAVVRGMEWDGSEGTMSAEMEEEIGEAALEICAFCGEADAEDMCVEIAEDLASLRETEGGDKEMVERDGDVDIR